MTVLHVNLVHILSRCRVFVSVTYYIDSSNFSTPDFEETSVSFPIIVFSVLVTLRLLRILLSFCLHARPIWPLILQ